MPREGGGLINFTKVHRGEGREQDEEEQNENQEKDNGADVDLEDENWDSGPDIPTNQGQVLLD